jgi:hypothetical protein
MNKQILTRITELLEVKQTLFEYTIQELTDSKHFDPTLKSLKTQVLNEMKSLDNQINFSIKLLEETDGN